MKNRRSPVIKSAKYFNNKKMSTAPKQYRFKK